MKNALWDLIQHQHSTTSNKLCKVKIPIQLSFPSIQTVRSYFSQCRSNQSYLIHVVIDQAFLFKGTLPFSHTRWCRIYSRLPCYSFPQEIIKNYPAVSITSSTNGPDCGKSKATLQGQKDEQLSKKLTYYMNLVPSD